MRQIVLTIDYEIFGNGTGDVREHVVDPTERMARIAERYDAPLTIFVEMEELLAFERHASELRDQLGYVPHDLIRGQVKDLAERGHDMQLHLHPQWHHAALVGGRWRLDDTKQTVDSLFSTVQETIRYIGDRKGELEEMVRGSAPNKPVVAYRAGAFSAQPGRNLIPALVKNRIEIDSSVVVGLQHQNEYLRLDYRNAPADKPMWRVGADVAVEDPSGPLVEIPIGSVSGRRFHQATFGRLKAKFSKHVPREQQGKLIRELGVSGNPLQLARFLWQEVPIKFDFHNVSPRKLLRWIQAVPKPPPGSLDVVVLIGHTKEHCDDRMFESFVAAAAAEQDLRIVSFGELAEQLKVAGQSIPRQSALCCAG